VTTADPARRRRTTAPTRAPRGGKVRGAAGAAPAARGAARDDEVYASIYDALLDHRLPPGTKLKEIPLAELFGVTRNVVRKALARLAHEQLVQLRVNRGAVVASPSVEESRDLFAARKVIEGALVESLARAATRAQVRELRALVQEENAAYQRMEVQEGLRLSREFHRVLARVAGNRVLAQFVDQLVARTPLVLLAYRGPVQPQAACANDEHIAIVEAIAAGDGARAASLMSAHLDSLTNQLHFEPQQASTDLAAIFGRKK
jgi:DNA-binding GntR family transcriptional regulator